SRQARRHRAQQHGDQHPHASGERVGPSQRSAQRSAPRGNPQREASMIRAKQLLAAATFVVAAGSAAESQSLANRVSSAPDGRVQFSFAARPGICGNGRTYIQTGPNSITGSVSYSGNYYG